MAKMEGNTQGTYFLIQVREVEPAEQLLFLVFPFQAWPHAHFVFQYRLLCLVWRPTNTIVYIKIACIHVVIKKKETQRLTLYQGSPTKKQVSTIM